MRRSLLLLTAAAASAVLLLVGAATAASPSATLTATPRATTSDRTAVFRWKTGAGRKHSLCRLRWRPRPGGAAQARPKLTQRFRRCHLHATWKHLTLGRYTFLLVVRSHRGRARWLSYSWEIVPADGGSSASPTPPSTTTATTTTTPSPPPPPPPPPPPAPPPPPPPPTPTPPPSSTNCVHSPYTYLWPVYPAVSSAEQQFVTLVNQARQSLGLKPLAVNSSLSIAADSHSYWQDVAFGYSGLTHEPGCNGSTPWDRMADVGYNPGNEGEVTLVSYPAASAQQAFTMFKNSPPHWTLLTSPNFTQIGVGESAYHWTGDLWGP